MDGDKQGPGSSFIDQVTQAGHEIDAVNDGVKQHRLEVLAVLAPVVIAAVLKSPALRIPFENPLALVSSLDSVQKKRISDALETLSKDPEGKKMVDMLDAYQLKTTMSGSPLDGGGYLRSQVVQIPGGLTNVPTEIHVPGYTTQGGLVAAAAHELQHLRQAQSGVSQPFTDGKIPSAVDVIRYNSFEEADAQATATEIAWRLKQQGDGGAWRSLKTGTSFGWGEQMASAYEKAVKADPGAVASGVAKRAAFDAWYKEKLLDTTIAKSYVRQGIDSYPQKPLLDQMAADGARPQPMTEADFQKIGTLSPVNYLALPGAKPLSGPDYAPPLSDFERHLVAQRDENLKFAVAAAQANAPSDSRANPLSNAGANSGVNPPTNPQAEINPSGAPPETNPVSKFTAATPERPSAPPPPEPRPPEAPSPASIEEGVEGVSGASRLVRGAAPLLPAATGALISGVRAAADGKSGKEILKATGAGAVDGAFGVSDAKTALDRKQRPADRWLAGGRAATATVATTAGVASLTPAAPFAVPTAVGAGVANLGLGVLQDAAYWTGLANNPGTLTQIGQSLKSFDQICAANASKISAQNGRLIAASKQGTLADDYMKALASGNRQTAEIARAEYEDHVINLTNHRTISPETGIALDKMLRQAFDLAETNGFKLPPAAPAQAAPAQAASAAPPAARANKPAPLA